MTTRRTRQQAWHLLSAWRDGKALARGPRAYVMRLCRRRLHRAINRAVR